MNCFECTRILTFIVCASIQLNQSSFISVVDCGPPGGEDGIPGINLTVLPDITTYGTRFTFDCATNFTVQGNSSIGSDEVTCVIDNDYSTENHLVGYWGIGNLKCTG